MYNSLAKYIWTSDLKDKVQMKFIDIMKFNMEDYPKIMDLLRKGCLAPIISINGVPKFHGGISNETIYNEIEKCLNK